MHVRPIRPAGRPAYLLLIEELEARNPVSTLLDALLAEALLPVAGMMPNVASTKVPDLISDRGALSQPSPVSVDIVPSSLLAFQVAAPRPRTPIDPTAAPGLLPQLSDADLGTLSQSSILTPTVASQFLLAPPSGERPVNQLAQVGSVAASEGLTPGALPAPASGQLFALASKADLRPSGKSGNNFHLNALAHISLTASTSNIPVNANKTNLGPWKKDAAGADLVGIPAVRDFDLRPMRNVPITWNGEGEPPAGPAIIDPDLKRLTATVVGGDPTGQIQVDVSFANPSDGGRVRLWTDQTKTTEILPGGFLPAYPTCDFYAEGTRPSKSVNDITITVTYQSATQGFVSETALSVTPVVNEFSVNPKEPATATFLKTAGHAIYGISSGEQADGAGRGSTTDGVRYTADLNVEEISGNPWFLQNVTTLNHSSPTVVLTNGTQYDLSFFGAQFPLLDWVAPPVGATAPFYVTLPDLVYNSHHKRIWSFDTPALGDSTLFAGVLSSMDATFQARMYLVWQFPAPDNSIYTLAYADWQAVFQAYTAPFIGLQLAQNSVVSASPKVLSHTDPAKIVGPDYNSFIADPGFWYVIS